METNETSPEVENNGLNLETWKKRFKSADKMLRKEHRPKYLVAKSRLRSDYDVKSRGSRKMTHENVNLVHSIGTNFVNSVYFKSPNCNLTARDEVDHRNVENTEILVNDWLKDKKVKRVIKRCIWDAYLGGFGFRYVDYLYNDYETGNVIGYQQAPQIDPMTGQQVMVDDLNQPIYQRVATKNEVIIYRLRPDLMRFPRGFDFDNYQESPWIGFDLIMPVEDAKGNENWDPNAREKLEGEKYEKLSDGDSNSESFGEEDLYVKVSYVFIKPQDDVSPFKRLVFHDKCDVPLEFNDYDKGHIGYPVKPLYFNPLDDDATIPNGDPWIFESQLRAVDTWWKKMGRHVERSNPKTVYDSGVVDSKEVQNLKSNNDLEWVGISNKAQRPLSDLIMELNRASVHPDTSRFYEVARNLISELAPKSSLSTGSGDSADTATEAKIMQVGEVIDVDARIDDVRDFIVDIVLDVSGILENSLNSTMTVMKPVPDQPSMQIPEAVGRDGFTSKVLVDVDVESMQAQNKDVFRRQLLDALKFLINFEAVMNKVGKTLNPLFWLERIMETMNIRNVEKGIMDLPPVQPVIGQTPPLQPMGGDAPVDVNQVPEAQEFARAERV